MMMLMMMLMLLLWWWWLAESSQSKFLFVKKYGLMVKWSILLCGPTFPKAEGSILIGATFFIIIIIIRPNQIKLN